jgi:hypothetical protein
VRVEEVSIVRIEQRHVEVEYGGLDREPPVEEPRSAWETVAVVATAVVGVMMALLCVVGL